MAIRRKRTSTQAGFTTPAKRKARLMAWRRSVLAQVQPRMRSSKLSTLGLELKYLDCAWNGVTINASTDGTNGQLQPSSGCTDALSIPAVGDTETTRDGRKYTIKSIWVSGEVDTAPLMDQIDMVDLGGYFFALVLDTQANGATISSGNVYINPSTSAIAMAPMPLRNLQFSKRYKILASQYVKAGGAYAGTDGASTNSIANQQRPVVNLSWKGNIVCDSTGTTANVTSASDNAIHLIGYTTSGLTSTFIGKSRMRFLG